MPEVRTCGSQVKQELDFYSVRLLNYYTIHPDKKTDFRIFEVMFLKVYIIGF